MKDPRRYDPREKVARNTLIREYRANHKEISLAAIGRLFSISKQRVDEITRTGRRYGKA